MHEICERSFAEVLTRSEGLSSRHNDRGACGEESTGNGDSRQAVGRKVEEENAVFAEDLFCLMVNRFGHLKYGKTGGYRFLWYGFAATAGVEGDLLLRQFDKVCCCEDVAVDVVAQFRREGKEAK